MSVVLSDNIEKVFIHLFGKLVLYRMIWLQHTIILFCIEGLT